MASHGSSHGQDFLMDALQPEAFYHPFFLLSLLLQVLDQHHHITVVVVVVVVFLPLILTLLCFS